MICGAVGLFLGLFLTLVTSAAMMIAALHDSADELDHSKLVIEIQSDAIDSCRQTIDSNRIAEEQQVGVLHAFVQVIPIRPPAMLSPELLIFATA
jgi:hypothetical protein